MNMTGPRNPAPDTAPDTAPAQPDATPVALDTLLASPEGQAAISAMLDEKIKALLPNVGGGERAFFERLMAQMNQMSDRDTGRVTLPPDVLARQEASRKRMGALIMERRDAIDQARREGRDEMAEWPLYRIIDKVFLVDFMIEPYQRDEATKSTVPTMLHWDGVPNACMKPMNDFAEEIHDAFADSICTTEHSAKHAPVDVWISHAGVVMKGQPPRGNRHRVGNTDAANMANPVLELDAYRAKFGITGQPSPGASKVFVLGTIHPQASQNYRGGPDAAPAQKLSGTL